MTRPGHDRPRVVIIGAGFAGLTAARTLAGEPVDVVILDRNNYHAFVPLLYQVGAAQVGAEDIVHPVRSVFRKNDNVRFRMVRVDRIDRQRKRVAGDGTEIGYDFLVLAAGSRTNYLGVAGAREHGLPFKTIHHALAVRNWILSRVERAAATYDPDQRKELLTFVIVGGGPTGVELAGALGELVRGSLARDFKDLDLGEARILLVEALDRVLPTFSERASDYAAARLADLGIDVRTGAMVEAVEPDAIRLEGGEVIRSDAVVWAAGVKGNPIAGACRLPVTDNGSVPVDRFLRAEDDPDVFVAGDIAAIDDDGDPVPMVAQAAIQAGRHAAHNILRQIRGDELEPFRYRDPGTMAAVGKGRAVVEIRGRTLTGIPAWPAWAFVHIGKLIGFRNRLAVMLNWAADYLFSERALRLIMPFEQVADMEPTERDPVHGE